MATDYSQVFLIKKDKKIIKMLKKKKRLPIHPDMDFLLEHRFVIREVSEDLNELGESKLSGYVILGDEYEHYCAYRFDHLLAQLPNWIAITISLISLIISIISVLIQI